MSKKSRAVRDAQKSAGKAMPIVEVSKLSLVEAPSTSELKLDLGCGQTPREGFEGVDMYAPGAKHKVDLFKFPWMFKDESVDELHCSHFLEHVPAREIETRDLVHRQGVYEDKDYKQFVGQDMLFAFMDECYRILKPGGWMHIVVPSGRSNRAFQDPTHRRFFVLETFCYFSRTWRQQNKLDHYRVKCNLEGDLNFSMPTDEGVRAQEVQLQRMNTMWNVTVDFMAKLQKKP